MRKTSSIAQQIAEQKALRARIYWQESMVKNTHRVLDLLQSLDRERLTFRSTPQYGFKCNRCGLTAHFKCREIARALKEIHRPKLFDEMGRYLGRAHHCNLYRVTKRHIKSGKIRTLNYETAWANLPDGYHDADDTDFYVELIKALTEYQNEDGVTFNTVAEDGSSEAGEESGGAGTPAADGGSDADGVEG